MTPIIGVDPGVRGGIALLRAQDGSVECAIPFRPYWTHRELVDTICLTAAVSRLAFVEKVGYMGRRINKKTGEIQKDGGQGAFTFGRVDGLIRGALLASGVTIREVLPMTWQSRMKCLTGGDKNVSKRRAQELFPNIKITHGIADALLIARYGWESMRL
jgi:hypothetical protein